MKPKAPPEGFTRSLSLYWGWRTQRLMTARSASAAADADADAAAIQRGRFHANAAVLQCEHWLEMADERHRYGSNLLPYFEWWWREHGDGGGGGGGGRKQEEEEEEEEAAANGGGEARPPPPPPPADGDDSGPRRVPSLLPVRRSLSVLANDAARRDAAARRFFAFLDGTPEGRALDLGKLPREREEDGNAAAEEAEGDGGAAAPHAGAAGPPREKLERERVRYLTPQERAELEVGVDGSGRLVYKRSGARVHTRGGEQEKKQQAAVVAAAAAAAATATGDSGAAAAESAAAAAAAAAAGDDDDAEPREDGETMARALAPFLSAASAAGELDDDDDDDDDEEEEEEAAAGDAPSPAPDAPAPAPTPGPAANDDPDEKPTNKPCKWIWVLDRQRRLYVHAKRRGTFHHSSFVEGGEVLSAGGLDADGGRIRRLTADSGHYRPSLDNFMATVSLLRDWGADLSAAVLSAKHIAAPASLGAEEEPIAEADEAGAEEQQQWQPPAAMPPPKPPLPPPPSRAPGARAPSLGAMANSRFADSVMLESAVNAALRAEGAAPRR
jgi:hypothetical protein